MLGEPGISQVMTQTPAGTHQRWLGSIGHVTPPAYSYALPGGPDQLTCTLQADARLRTDALDPGRTVRVYRGGQAVWDGKLLEPTPGPDGWAITANGAGNFGTDFLDFWTVPHWTDVNSHINAAITRGLRWVNPGLSNTGLWFGQVVDQGSQTITDLLNMCCTSGGRVWYVRVTPQGNILSIFPLPAAADRVLISATPVARTLGGDINSLYVRYQNSLDGAAAATFSTVNVTTPASITKHGTQEAYEDFSSAGYQTSGTITTDAANILARYQRASFAGPFTARPGEVLTLGGQPVDIGMEQAGHVYKVILTDYGYGGEIVPGPVTFLSGAVAYDDAAQTLTITPFQSLNLSLTNMLSALSATMPPVKIPRAPGHWGGHGKGWIATPGYHLVRTPGGAKWVRWSGAKHRKKN